MTREGVRTWLATRRPEPPAALAVRLTAVLEACPDALVSGTDTLAELMGALGIRTLRGLEGRDPSRADVALDLLAADALVTYAFEAAAEGEVDVPILACSLLREATL